MEAWRVGLFNLSILREGFSLFLSVSHTKRNQTHRMLKFCFFKNIYIICLCLKILRRKVRIRYKPVIIVFFRFIFGVFNNEGLNPSFNRLQNTDSFERGSIQELFRLVDQKDTYVTDIISV